MKTGDVIEFKKTLNSDKTVTGKVIGQNHTQDLNGNRPFWSVEVGKKVKRSITIHESQIVGLVRNG
jgi:hypothetical protein